MIDHLQARGFSVEDLARSEARRFFTAWCHAFLGDVHQSTGKYGYLGFHWHAVSYEFTAAQSGPSALEAYLSLESQPVLVIPEDWRNSCGVRCSGHGLPDPTELRDDLYVFPESLEWSMAFTHEHPRCGPYFACGNPGQNPGEGRNFSSAISVTFD